MLTFCCPYELRVKLYIHSVEFGSRPTSTKCWVHFPTHFHQAQLSLLFRTCIFYDNAFWCHNLFSLIRTHLTIGVVSSPSFDIFLKISYREGGVHRVCPQHLQDFVVSCLQNYPTFNTTFWHTPSPLNVDVLSGSTLIHFDSCFCARRLQWRQCCSFFTFDAAALS